MKLYPILLGIALLTISCNLKRKNKFEPHVVYQSDRLIITQITKSTYQHISFLPTKDFGLVACNGLLIKNGNKVLVFDTTTESESSAELIQWVKDTLHSHIIAVIPTHFHDDNLGGLQAFETNKIPSFAYFKTLEFAKDNQLPIPKNSFRDSLVLKVGTERVLVKFMGEGHTKDNIIGYFPSERVMFGGCLIKELNASKGYLGDANTKEWSHTVLRIKEKFPDVDLIIPGHGEPGNQKLLDYTIQLFKNESE